MLTRWFIFGILFGIAASSASKAQELPAEQLLKEYSVFHKKTLQRLLELEDRIDGLTSEFRSLLSDRKTKYEVSFKGPGKVLAEPVLLSAIISERKRLEKDQSFIEELEKRRGLSKQYLKRMGTNILALELSSLLISYVGYLDEFNRGIRKVPGYETQPDPELLKVLAASLTAFEYTKEKKSNLYFSDKRLVDLDPEGARNALALLESALGKLDEDSIMDLKAELPPSEKSNIEMARLKKTKNLIRTLHNLAAQISFANKALLDEYQYHVIKLNQSLKNKRQITGASTK